MMAHEHIGNLQKFLLRVRNLWIPKAVRPLEGKVCEDY